MLRHDHPDSSLGQLCLSWQGRQTVWGLWFPPHWQEPERLLSAWLPGCRLLQAWQGWLLIYAQAQVLQVEQAPAQAVVAVAQGWSSFGKGRPGPQQVALRWHGQDWVGALAEMAPLDLAQLWQWSELEFELARVAPPALSRPVLVRSAPEPLRQILPAIPAPAPEQQQLLQRLSQPAVPKNPLLGFFDLLKSFFGSPENQRYMNKMLELFEQKNWQEALRHAIPLNESGTSSQLGAFLGQLKPRSGLEFTTPTPGYSIDTSLHGMDLLKDIYRRALRQLVADGRIEEAAYVQGELLGEAAGAAELLEQHGRFEAAARLATLKGLPAALQVRLWFQAGRADTAMLLARRYGVQAEALQMLQRKDPPLANRFRAAWATDLADAGRQAEAITVGWSVREQLEDYELWLRSALAVGGSAAVEVLVLGLRDADLAERLGLVEVLQDWFRDFDLLTQPRRRLLLERLAESWLETTRHSGLREWAGLTARRVMRQANSPLPLGSQRTLDFLVKLSGDPWLRADRLPSIGGLAPRLGLWSETIEARGHTPLYDALWLGDGRLLAALGQAGLMVLSRGGAVSQSFAQPAYDLIHGERQLVRSGHTLSWFDGSKLRFWCQAALDGWADEHDGYHWLVWLDRQLFQIDLLSTDWRALQSRDLPARPIDASLNRETVGLDLGFELQVFRLPQLDSGRSCPIPSGSQLCTSRSVEAFQVHGERLHFHGLQLHLEGQNPQFRERGGFCLIQTAYAHGQELLVFPLDNPSLQFSLKLPGADRLKVRVQGWLLVVCDNLGRLLVADLKARVWIGQFFL